MFLLDIHLPNIICWIHCRQLNTIHIKFLQESKAYLKGIQIFYSFLLVISFLVQGIPEYFRQECNYFTQCCSSWKHTWWVGGPLEDHSYFKANFLIFLKLIQYFEIENLIRQFWYSHLRFIKHPPTVDVLPSVLQLRCSYCLSIIGLDFGITKF